MYKYAYIVGCIIIFFLWLFIFLSKRSDKKRIVVGGLFGIPFGMTESFYVPEYWKPDSLFNLIEKIGFGIESVLFAFLVGGIASSIYKFIFPMSNSETKSSNPKNHLFYPIVLITYLLLEVVFPEKTIYNMIFVFIVAGSIVAFTRRNLSKQVLFSGLLFMCLYYLLFVVFSFVYPDFFINVYSLENFLGIWVLHLPIEEHLFALSVGLCWSVLYDITFGNNLKDKK